MVSVPDSIQPPWSPEQVKALNRFQEAGFVHPFTCPNNHGSQDERVLKATPNGWVCLRCGYTQDWAHRFMLEEPRDPLEAMRRE